MRRHFYSLLAMALTSPLLVPATALAQDDPKISQKSSVLPGYLAAAFFGGVLILLTLFPSKRQHEDL
jgi:hypothetical protein